MVNTGPISLNDLDPPERSGEWLVDPVEVMSMDRKLWTEAQAIAARNEHGNRAEGEDLAQDLAVAALENDAAAARQPGGLAGAGGAERRHRSLAPVPGGARR